MENHKSKKLELLLRSDRIYHGCVVALWVVILFLIIYPLYLVLIASVSDPDAVYKGEIMFLPKNISWMGYEAVFKFGEMWNSYLNSIFYTVLGTMLSIAVTMMAAYAISRKFPGKWFFNFIFVLVMFFSGGLIPTFLILRDLGLYNTRAVMIINGCLSVWNLMIARTYIQNTMPEEIFEAAQIDGASHVMYFICILLPTCTTIIAVLAVYYGVGKWNDYFTGLVYLRDRKLLPLQTLLREILATLQVSNNDFAMIMDDYANQANAIRTAQVAKYCIIVVSTGPAVLLYVLMQKYFVKGVMIGSIKG